MREYTVSGAGLTVSGSSILVFLNPPTTCMIELIRAWCGQSQNAVSAQQRIEIGFKASVFPTVTAATPSKTKSSDPASLLVGGTAGAAGTCGINASANGAGTESPIVQAVFNTLNGYEWLPNFALGETIHSIAGATSPGVYMKFPVAPTNLLNWTFGLEYRELG